MRRKNDPSANEDIRTYRAPMAITIPSGKCPATLGSTDVDSLKLWIKSIIDAKPVGYGYEPTVFKYWSRQFFCIVKQNDEYRLICSLVDTLLRGKTIFTRSELPF